MERRANIYASRGVKVGGLRSLTKVGCFIRRLTTRGTAQLRREAWLAGRQVASNRSLLFRNKVEDHLAYAKVSANGATDGIIRTTEEPDLMVVPNNWSNTASSPFANKTIPQVALLIPRSTPARWCCRSPAPSHGRSP
jgi:hypothetical protein